MKSIYYKSKTSTTKTSTTIGVDRLNDRLLILTYTKWIIIHIIYLKSRKTVIAHVYDRYLGELPKCRVIHHLIISNGTRPGLINIRLQPP